jgi:hypothetical protein
LISLMLPAGSGLTRCAFLLMRCDHGNSNNYARNAERVMQ